MRVVIASVIVVVDGTEAHGAFTVINISEYTSSGNLQNSCGLFGTFRHLFAD
jgi:hypothetical protein